VSTIQGNFLSPEIQAEVRSYVQDRARGRARKLISLSSGSVAGSEQPAVVEEVEDGEEDGEYGIENGHIGEIHGLEISPEELAELEKGYIDHERSAHLETSPIIHEEPPNSGKKEETTLSQSERDEQAGRVVDIVLSDMSAPWPQTSSFRQNSISDIYRRMMNTSGNAFRDHVKSMVRP
jgi:21S rRNA (uridine2791-2'-O)-methyltransferase